MPAVEIGWRLAHDQWGHGYASEAARASLQGAFGTYALSDVVSLTFEGNLRSCNLMERIGMTHAPADDFTHPRLAGHALAPHVLYRITAAQWRGFGEAATG
ncbi:MAG: GNAT family N-acetyltransferase [Acidimicrobiales bacterium]